ncbi:hypothetical protein ES705_33780 [subsurface metagenome]
MIRNYILVAFRNLIRNKVHSIINIGGLAIGVAMFILIMMYVRHELSFDKFHKNYERIYKVSIGNRSCMHAPLVEFLKMQFPEIQKTFRFFLWWNTSPLIKYSENSFVINNCAYADSTIFEIFSFPVLHGDPITALRAKEVGVRKVMGSKKTDLIKQFLNEAIVIL